MSVLLVDPEVPGDQLLEIRNRAAPVAVALAGATLPAPLKDLPHFSVSADGIEDLPAAPPPPLPVRPDDAAVLLVTSGTAGHPRAVALSSRNLSANIAAAREVLPCDRQDRFLSVLPASHAFEVTAGLLGPLACGASIVSPPSRNPNRLLDLASPLGITRIHLVPAILEMFVEALEEEHLRGSGNSRLGLGAVVCGGAPASPGLISRALRLGLPLWLGYGLTEAGPMVALGRADQIPEGSTGRALPGVEVQIEEESGEILVRGPAVMMGYAGDLAATEKAVSGGWLRTGDVGRIDGQGHLFVLGRRREEIVTAAGVKLLPEEIEAAYGSPLFAEVCAVGVPDPAGGERPHLAVVPAPQSRVHGEALKAEWQRLSSAAGVRRTFGITILEGALPRTPNQKVRRGLVRAEILRRQGTAG
jgi:long-chain acyl-CoA synthetase